MQVLSATHGQPASPLTQPRIKQMPLSHVAFDTSHLTVAEQKHPAVPGAHAATAAKASVGVGVGMPVGLLPHLQSANVRSLFITQSTLATTIDLAVHFAVQHRFSQSQSVQCAQLSTIPGAVHCTATGEPSARQELSTEVHWHLMAGHLLSNSAESAL